MIDFEHQPEVRQLSGDVRVFGAAWSRDFKNHVGDFGVRHFRSGAIGMCDGGPDVNAIEVYPAHRAQSQSHGRVPIRCVEDDGVRNSDVQDGVVGELHFEVGDRVAGSIDGVVSPDGPISAGIFAPKCGSECPFTSGGREQVGHVCIAFIWNGVDKAEGCGLVGQDWYRLGEQQHGGVGVVLVRVQFQPQAQVVGGFVSCHRHLAIFEFGRHCTHLSRLCDDKRGGFIGFEFNGEVGRTVGRAGHS